MAGGGGDPWKNRKMVRICSATDMVNKVIKYLLSQDNKLWDILGLYPGISYSHTLPA